MPTENLEYLDESGINRTGANVLAKIAEAKAQIEAELDSLSYAQPDGIYPDMTVGAVIGADETAQWATRESTGTGSATVRSVQGAAVAWNQLAPEISDANWYKNAGVTVIYNDDVVRLTFVNDGVTTASSARVEVRPDFFAGNGAYNHKFLVVSDVKPSKNMQMQMFLFGRTLQGVESGKTILATKTNINAGVTTRVANIVTETNEDVYWVKMGIGICGDSSRPVLAGDYCDVSNAMLFDLTQMFGAGNEPTTVAEFEAMFPAAYYPYSTPTLKPVQIAGIASTDANGDALDSVEWGTQTLRAAGSVADMLYSDHVDVKVAAVDLGTLSWVYDTSGTVPFFRSKLPSDYAEPTTAGIDNLECGKYEAGTSVTKGWYSSNERDKSIRPIYGQGFNVGVQDSAYTDAASLKAALAGELLFYELATPTTTPISPALPMTYRVEQGGAESIIVPAGEISAAPILTVADPVNMSTELALIWAAIEALQARGSLQLSRVDMGNVDEVQKDTEEIAEIETVKEVQE